MAAIRMGRSLNFEGRMDTFVYERFGNQPQPERAYTELRHLIGRHIFGAEFIPVPFLESAGYFNQLYVFIKQRSLLSTVGLQPPTYKLVGNMDYLLNREVSTWRPQYDFSPWKVEDNDSEIIRFSRYHLRIWPSDDGVEKYIDFKAIDLRERGANPPTVGDVRIHRSLADDLKWAKTVYVVTDVVLASNVNLLVRIGDESATFTKNGYMPIGFRYKKYKLRRDGTFVDEIYSSIKYFAEDAIWLQPFPKPIPNAPLWCYTRRRYHGGERINLRSSLTIGNIKDTSQLVHRRLRQDEGIIFFRPVDEVEIAV